MRSGGAHPRPRGTRPGVIRWVHLALLLLLVGGPAGAEEPQSGFRRLVSRVMLQPQMKKDTGGKRIAYATTTPLFPIPTDLAKPIDEHQPATFTIVFADLSLSDNEPLAPSPDQLGAEDVLLIVLRTSGSGPIFWKIRDAGLRGLGEAALKELVPPFGEEQKARYRDVVDRINTVLDAETAKGARK